MIQETLILGAVFRMISVSVSLNRKPFARAYGVVSVSDSFAKPVLFQ